MCEQGQRSTKKALKKNGERQYEKIITMNMSAFSNLI